MTLTKSLLSVALLLMPLTTTLPSLSQSQMPPGTSNEMLRQQYLRSQAIHASRVNKFRGHIPTNVEPLKNIPYVAGTTDRAHLLNIYIPKDARPGNKGLPTILFVHGGAWIEGDKELGWWQCAPFVQAGYILVSINYRFSNEAKFPAQIYDVKAAVRWLRANANKYGIDPNRIGAFGQSAGGHLVALLGTTNGDPAFEGNEGNLDQSSRVQAVCDEFGPTDFTNPDLKVENTHTAGAVVNLLGSTPKDKPELARKASPIFHITKNCPPFLIIHGDRDETVPISQSQEFFKALKKQGVDAKFRIVQGGAHGGSEFGEPIMQEAIEFFNHHLK